MKIYLKNEIMKRISGLILGISTSIYVVYLTKIGNTTLRFDMIVGILIFLICALKKNIVNDLKEYFNIYILIFGIIIISSGLNVIYVSSLLGHQEIYLKAIIISYIIPSVFYSSVIFMRESKMSIINGMIIGLALNISLSVIQYLTFNSGQYFTLFGIFPQSSFYLPVYNFRTMGFFLEPSHMLQFIISTFLLFIVCFKRGFIKFTMISSIILVVLLSKSSNVIILIFMVLVFYIVKKKEKKKNSRYLILFNLLILTILVINFHRIGLFLRNINVENLIDYIFFRDRSDGARLIGMKTALQYIVQYPLGIGYGMSKTLFNFYGTAESSYNYMLTIQIELGFFGAIIYMMRIYAMGIQLVFNRLNNYQIAIGISIIGSEIAAILNGGYFGTALWVLYGLASIEIYNFKKSKYESFVI